MLRRGAGSRRRRTASVGSGALWSGLSTIVMKAANIGVTVIVVRLVTPHDFGVFTAALVAGTIATAISELGVASALIRRDLPVEDLAPTVVAIAWVWSAILSALMAAFAEPLAAVLGTAEAADPIRVLSIGVLFSGFSAVPGALLAREFRQGTLFAAGVLAFVPSSVLLVLLAAGGAGAMSFAWSKVIGAVVTMIVMSVCAKRWFWPRLDVLALRRVLALGAPLAGANLIGYVLLNADFALVGHSLGPTLLGIYSIAFSVSSLAVSAMSSVLNSVAMPAFSDHGGAPAGVRASVEKWLRAVFLVSVPVCGLTVVFSREIVAVLYGPAWAAAAAVVGVLALYGIPMLVELMLSNLLVALGRTVSVFWVQGTWLVALTAAMLAGLAVMGLEGVAWAHVVVLALIVLPLQFGLLRRAVPGILAGLWRLAIRPIVATIAVALVAVAVSLPLPNDGLKLLVGGATAVIAYAVGLRREWIPYVPAPAGRGVPERSRS